jgi:hypothetical protein
MGDADRDKIWESALMSDNVVYLGAIQMLRSILPKTTTLLTIAKLTKELLTHVEKAKIDMLRRDEQASKRRSNFHSWIPKMKAIIGMFEETSCVIPDDTIVMYEDEKCAGNKELFTLLTAKIDNSCQDIIRPFHSQGDRALNQLYARFAPITQMDTDHYHQQFVGLKVFADETATHFISRFIVGKTQAERAKSTYPEAQLITYMLTSLNPTRRTNYQLIAAIFQEKLQNNETVLFSDLERRLLAADETAARINGQYNSTSQPANANAVQNTQQR